MRAHHLSPAGQELEHVARHPGLVQEGNRARGDERRLLRRLGDDGIAGRERRRDLAAIDGEREVPRADAGEHAAPVERDAVGLARRPGQHHRRGEFGPRPRGVVAAEIDRLAHLGHAIADGLPRLARAHGHELGHMGFHEAGHAVEAGRALGRRSRVPAPGRGHGRGERRIRLGPARLDHRADPAPPVGGVTGGHALAVGEVTGDQGVGAPWLRRGRCHGACEGN